MQDKIKTLKERFIKISSNAAIQLSQYYQLDKKILGKGSFGKVYLAHSKIKPDQAFAIK